nr:MAG TPA: hypothetical protein [Caudoviricetes sp.]
MCARIIMQSFYTRLPISTRRPRLPAILNMIM